MVFDDSAERKPGFTLGQLATLACFLEATASKPGNVHRGADFDDVSFVDFAVAGVAIGPAVECAAQGDRLGTCVLEAVRAMRSTVNTNTSLGTILLLVPLAQAASTRPWSEGIRQSLANLTPDDTRDVYHAIRLAQPGGMGKVEEGDLEQDPPQDLLWAMQQAAQRDLVARQYTNGFQHVLELVVPCLKASLEEGRTLSDAIVLVFLKLLAQEPDSLIARKCGIEVARRASLGAQRILAAGDFGSDDYYRELADLDFWLRSDGHRRNPGTTADLIAAGLFVALVDGIIQFPLRFYPGS